MSTPENESGPDWSLLPGNPTEFFGLKPDAGRKELKRSYNRLVKRFKPERYPEEFQRIRRAFEQLEDQLRYGTSAPSPVLGATLPSPAAEPAERSPEPAEEDAEPLAPAEPALAAQIREEGVDSVRSRLAAKASLTPAEAYALAVLSDLPNAPERPDFLGWILRGLKDRPDDTGLVQMVRALLHSGAVPKEPGSLLDEILPLIPNRLVGFVTEPLWLSIAGQRPFEEVSERLERLRAESPPGVNHLRLSLRIARRAAFRADPDWLRERLGEGFEGLHLDPDLEEELEFLETLGEYRELRDEFLAGDVQAGIDRVLRAQAENDDLEAARITFAWLSAQRSKVGEILESIDPRDKAAYGAIPLLQHSIWSAESALGEELEPASEADRERAVRNFGQRIDTLTDRSMWGGLANFGYLLLGIVIPLGLLIAGGAFLHAQLDGFTGAFWLALVGWIAALVLLILKLYIPFAILPFGDWVSRRCYDSLWREEIVSFLKQNPISSQELLEAFREDAQCSKFTFSDELTEALAQDVGVHFASLVLHRR